MTTAWTLTAGDVVSGALELCGVVGSTDTVNAEDEALCLRALNGILKELPLHGLSWPKLSSAAVAVAWSGVTPGKVTPPADYFGVPVLKYTNASGTLTTLAQIAKPAFDALDLTQTAAYPTHFYVAPDRSFNLWPAPTLDPVLKLTYQAIISDAVASVTPDIAQAYLNGLQYWVANEVSLKFGVPADVRAELAARADQKRRLMIQWATDLAPVAFEVAG